MQLTFGELLICVSASMIPRKKNPNISFNISFSKINRRYHFELQWDQMYSIVSLITECWLFAVHVCTVSLKDIFVCRLYLLWQGKKKKYWWGTTSPSEPTDFPLVDITASNIRELKVTAQREVVRLFHQFDEVRPFSFQTTLQQICNPAFCYDTPKDASCL